MKTDEQIKARIQQTTGQGPYQSAYRQALEWAMTTTSAAIGRQMDKLDDMPALNQRGEAILSALLWVTSK
jgi:hypothetical protein